MAKQKTSKKRGHSLTPNDLQSRKKKVTRKETVRLMPTAQASHWQPTLEMLDENRIAKSLFDCLKMGDTDGFKEILAAHLDAKVKTREAKKHGLSLRTMFEALSADGNPRLSTISKLVMLACSG